MLFCGSIVSVIARLHMHRVCRTCLLDHSCHESFSLQSRRLKWPFKSHSMCIGLLHRHRNGYKYMGMNTSKVLLKQERDNVKICDFGIATLAGRQASQEKHVSQIMTIWIIHMLQSAASHPSWKPIVIKRKYFAKIKAE